MSESESLNMIGSCLCKKETRFEAYTSQCTRTHTQTYKQKYIHIYAFTRDGKVASFHDTFYEYIHTHSIYTHV
jgi:hypothetical protein